MNFGIDTTGMTQADIEEVYNYYHNYYVDFELSANKPVTFNANDIKDGKDINTDNAETDEDEVVEELICSIEENKWQINGTASISEVEEAMGINITNEDSDTFGGYVLGLYGMIPEDGATFELSTDTLDISIEAIKDHKIEKAIVTLRTADEEPEEDPREAEKEDKED